MRVPDMKNVKIPRTVVLLSKNLQDIRVCKFVRKGKPWRKMTMKTNNKSRL